VVFGVFGLIPSADGSLCVAPAREPRSTGLALEGYRHGDELVSVHLEEDGFEVRTGSKTHRADYGETIQVVAPRRIDAPADGGGTRQASAAGGGARQERAKR